MLLEGFVVPTQVLVDLPQGAVRSFGVGVDGTSDQLKDYLGADEMLGVFV